ncbi:MAG: DUF6266 family protein [Bacteroidales bacterium]|nr:DUF6266 family protein [Bacteroidales bacterium]MDD2203828.1 DUF6266 family protein [Bacteroidales bacterium]MDD3913234.1 DUF6266 family protein [Bacteroidales bacterium]MDD4633264.1 DUF6266 family protein [Bacteroidales bacterium]
MAVINSVAVGAAKGKVGNIVYSRSAGRTIAREYQPSVKNPNTPEQQAQRTRMSAIVGLWNVFSAPMAKAFKGRKRTTSTYNAFVSANVAKMPNAGDTDVATVLAGKPAIEITFGSLGNVITTRESAAVVKADFSTCKNRLTVGDKLVVFSGNMAGEEVLITEQALTQEDITAGTVEINHDTEIEGFACVYAYTAKGNKSSNGKLLYW